MYKLYLKKNDLKRKKTHNGNEVKNTQENKNLKSYKNEGEWTCDLFHMLMKMNPVHSCVVTLWAPYIPHTPCSKTSILRNAALARPQTISPHLVSVTPLKKSLTFFPVFPLHDAAEYILFPYEVSNPEGRTQLRATTVREFSFPCENMTHTL